MMSIFLFPMAALALCFLIMMPLATLIGLVIINIKRKTTSRWAKLATPMTYGLLVAPTILPLSWLTSAAFHENEGKRALEHCIVDHTTTAQCMDALVLCAMLFILVACSIVRHMYQLHHKPPTTLDDAHPNVLRLQRISQNHPVLSKCRLFVTDDTSLTAMTLGWRPKIYIASRFLAQIDDEVLEAVLLHEAAHALGFDPLRLFMAELCLAINPLGTLLRPYWTQWRHAREAMCDEISLTHSADPLALAHGLILALKFERQALASCPLGGHQTQHIKLRINLLLEGSTAPSSSIKIHTLLMLAFIAMVITIPHFWHEYSLQYLHQTIELALLTPGW